MYAMELLSANKRFLLSMPENQFQSINSLDFKEDDASSDSKNWCYMKKNGVL